MKVALSIARRYLFGKKTTNAINIITGISVAGIAIGTAALILILSVFNGFEGLMKGYLDKFNPELKVVPAEGKFYRVDDALIAKISSVDGVTAYSKVIEEVASFSYGDHQQIGTIKGVDDAYTSVTSIVDATEAGEASFAPSEFGDNCVIGQGIYHSLDVALQNKLRSLQLHVPNRRKRGPLDKDIKSRPLTVSGVFAIQNERDNEYVISGYEMVSALLDLRGQASAIEIAVAPESDPSTIQQSLQSALGADYEVLNRYQQDESFLRIMNIEKWSSYLILSFTLLLITFNVIGSLWMIVLEKKKDLAVLQSYGADKSFVKKIFYAEGLMISGLGFLIGFVVAVIFYILQKQIGIISVPENFAISSYPIELKAGDVILILITVLALGLLASIPASIRAARVTPYVRVE